MKTSKEAFNESEKIFFLKNQKLYLENIEKIYKCINKAVQNGKTITNITIKETDEMVKYLVKYLVKLNYKITCTKYSCHEEEINEYNIFISWWEE